jgi:hypothetical protein
VDFDVTCAACPCSVSTKCTGTIAMSDQTDCQGVLTVKMAVDDGCHSVTTNGNFRYARYEGAIANDACNAGPAPTATVTLASPQTICCR